MQISRTFNGFFSSSFFFLTLFASNILYKLILDSCLKQVSFNIYYILYFKWLSLLRPYDWPLKNIGLLRSWSYPYPKNKPLCNIALCVQVLLLKLCTIMVEINCWKNFAFGSVYSWFQSFSHMHDMLFGTAKRIKSSTLM